MFFFLPYSKINIPILKTGICIFECKGLPQTTAWPPSPYLFHSGPKPPTNISQLDGTAGAWHSILRSIKPSWMHDSRFLPSNHPSPQSFYLSIYLLCLPDSTIHDSSKVATILCLLLENIDNRVSMHYMCKDAIMPFGSMSVTRVFPRGCKEGCCSMDPGVQSKT